MRTPSANRMLNVFVTLNHDLPGHPYLVVNSGNHLHIFEQDSEPAVITWRLSGNATDGKFCELEGPTAGFQWMGSPPPGGIFQELTLDDGGALRIHNHHRDRTTRGEWSYQLFARFGDNVYQTMSTSTNGPSATANPTIKNT